MVTVWIAVILGLSAFAWVNSKGFLTQRPEPPVLNIRWLDYLIFLWIFLILFLMMQTAMQFALPPVEESADSVENPTFSKSKEWNLVLSSLSLQIPMLGAMLFAFSMPKLPFFHAEPSNSSEGIKSEILFGFRSFLMCMPIVWAISALWKLVIESIYGLFTSDELEVQTVVSTVADSSDLAPVIILTMLGIIMAPIAEELFFRGSIYRFAKDRIGIRRGIVVSSLIFAVMHMNLRAFVPLFVVGVCLAWVYERRGNIWAPITFHAAFNAQSFAMIFMMRAEP